MTEILVNHPMFQVANFFLFLSYCMTSFLLLRICLVIANFLFMCWAIAILNIAVDVAVWTGSLAVVAGLMAIPLIKKQLPVKLEVDDEDLYNQMFKNHFSRRKFKMLVEKCMYKREIWTTNT